MTITAEQEMKRLFSELKELCGRERQGVLILVRSDGSGFMQNPEPDKDERPADGPDVPHI